VYGTVNVSALYELAVSTVSTNGINAALALFAIVLVLVDWAITVTGL
jgi:hypothetical protein